ncbi:MAG: hypothetical protein LW630_05355 [Saprospiraceae bacterium]|jgi:hypothetical protein|nr:hypothetical protein [Saprospiraceae bacterium]
MGDFLLFLMIGIFVALLFLNIYVRVKVLGFYKVLVQNQVQFDTSHFFNKSKMEKEVLSRYPSYRREILGFTSHIKTSLGIAVVLIVIITLAGYILKQL